jgi:glutamyl-tRNA synthetase
LIKGRCELQPAEIGGDFIVARWSGNSMTYSYQLAVVVDDHGMGINQVIRGDDLVASTPRQLVLYQYFGWDAPQFGHLSLVLDVNGRRLAKRDGSIKLQTLRSQGANPRRLVALLLKSLGQEVHQLEEEPA